MLSQAITGTGQERLIGYLRERGSVLQESDIMKPVDHRGNLMSALKDGPSGSEFADLKNANEVGKTLRKVSDGFMHSTISVICADSSKSYHLMMSSKFSLLRET